MVKHLKYRVSPLHELIEKELTDSIPIDAIATALEDVLNKYADDKWCLISCVPDYHNILATIIIFQRKNN